MLKKVFQTNPKDALTVGQHAKKVALVAAAAENVRCMMQHVQNAEHQQRFLSSQQAKDPFIAATASRKREAITKTNW